MIILGIIVVLVGTFMIYDYNKKINELDANTLSTKTTYSTYKSYSSSSSNSRSRGYTTMYTPQYHYNVNGRMYVCKTTYSSNIKPSQKPRTIFYNSKNPSECLPKSTGFENVIPFILVFFDIMAIVVGINKKESM